MAWFCLMLEPADYPSAVLAVSFQFKRVLKKFLFKLEELDSCSAAGTKKKPHKHKQK